MTEIAVTGRGARVKLVSTFADMGGLTRWVRLAFYAQILLALVGSVCLAMEYRLISNYEQAVYLTLGDALLDEAANRERMNALAWGHVAIFLVSAVLLLRWIHRASFNAWQLRSEGLRFTPSVVVSGFLVSPLVLWRSLQAMKEIHAVSLQPEAPLPSRATPLVLCWWLSWVSLPLLAFAYSRFLPLTDLAQQKMACMVGVGFNIGLTSLAIFSLALVDSIHRAQEQHGYGEASATPAAPAGERPGPAIAVPETPAMEDSAAFRLRDVDTWRLSAMDLTRKKAIGLLIILWWLFCVIGNADFERELGPESRVANILFALPFSLWGVQMIHAIRGDKDRLTPEIILSIGVWGYVWRFNVMLVLATLASAIIIFKAGLAPGESVPSLAYFIASNLFILMMMTVVCWVFFSRDRKAQLRWLLSILR